MGKKNVLVVYFSATGTTRHVAEQLADAAQADLCEIIPTEPYTAGDLDWHDRTSRSSVEMNNAQARPAIKTVTVDVGRYDYIFIGYPIWWDLAPRVVNTFIENNNLTGKIVIPFATSGSSGIAGSVAQLQKSYPQLNWRAGKLLNRANASSLKEWVDSQVK